MLAVILLTSLIRLVTLGLQSTLRHCVSAYLAYLEKLFAELGINRW